MSVKAWYEKVIIPTYLIGKPEKCPMFLEKRVYQGSSGTVYPYPVIGHIENTKTDQPYNAIFIENEYLKIMILPELGGRIQMAFDKIAQRHFVYYNEVIKPALVGLTGPWISGGIEFNWPQHHRPSTFLPVDHLITENNDGSVTVWVNETERMTHQKAMAGFTLHPGKAYLEIKVKLYNGTPLPQTFLWWANPAVAVNENYQSVFPTDVNAVFDHGKRAVSTFPIATGTYYKVDYSKGVDISKYKNIPVPTSFMAINSEYDFVGGYENDTKAGILHIANHHISPGKKQWTWGNGDFGKVWYKNLTDENGPYIELMAGVYTDNQPDFAWLQPFEEKSFSQFFIPYRELGIVKNASADFLINMEIVDETAIVKVLATSAFANIRLVLDGFFDEATNLCPETVFIKSVPVGKTPYLPLKLAIYLPDGQKVLSFDYGKNCSKTLPKAAEPVVHHDLISSTETLYLAGLHLEQNRHATFNPTDYYLKAIEIEPGNIRNNNAMGLWLLRRGIFGQAEQYLRVAVASQIAYNPNPYDGEALYNLGLSLKYQQKYDEAYSFFYKACWNFALQDMAYYACAQISIINGNIAAALTEVDKALIRNGRNHKARALKSVLLRKLNRISESGHLIQESLILDPFNHGCRFEKFVQTQNNAVLTEFTELMRDEIHNYEELALDLISSGLHYEAITLLEAGIAQCQPNPMTFYYLAWSQFLAKKDCSTTFFIASTQCPDYCFPNRLEAILALECALNLNPKDAKASYYLGNLWYDKRQYNKAVHYWEQSVANDPTFPIVYRNLSLAYYNKFNVPAKAIKFLEKAFRLDKENARILMELDQLLKIMGIPHHVRLTRLETNDSLVSQNSDLTAELIILYNQTENYIKAKELIDGQQFHPWEGGEGKITYQYQVCRLEIAKQHLRKKQFHQAIEFLKECLVLPLNLGEGKLPGVNENDFHYYLGCANYELGMVDQAQKHWENAAIGNIELKEPQFYNDQKPDKIFYQGKALQKLGLPEKAEEIYSSLIAFGNQHINDKIVPDFFAVSLPDLQVWEKDPTIQNQVHCNYLIGLGYLGLGKITDGINYLQKANSLDINHQGCQTHLQMALTIFEEHHN